MRVKWDLETNTVTSRAFITFLKFKMSSQEKPVCSDRLLIHLGWYAQKYETKRLNEKQRKKKDGECEKNSRVP